MTKSLYTDLSWLPPPPAQFSAQCHAAVDLSSGLGTYIQDLATHALDENQLNRLAKVIDRARQDGRSLAPLVPFRLGIVSNAISHFIVPVLVASAARHGIALECIEAGFDQVVQESLSPDSVISLSQPDAVLVAVDYHGLPLHVTPGDAETARDTVEATLAHLAKIRSGIKASNKAVCILQTLARPAEGVFGSLDLALPGTLRSLIDMVNRGIADS